MWSLIENVLCVLEMHVFYAVVRSCDLYMPVQGLLHFSEIFNVRCIYIFTCSSFLVNWPFYHYTIYLIALFFFLQFILSDITVSPALFRMGCLFPSFHFSPFHVLRFVSTTRFNSDILCVSCPVFFLLFLLLVAPAHVHHMLVKDRHPGQLLSCHCNFRSNVLNVSFLSWCFVELVLLNNYIFFHILFCYVF